MTSATALLRRLAPVLPVAALGALAFTGSGSAASSAPRVLAPQTTTLHAAEAQTRNCSAGVAPAGAKGVTTMSWTAPANGFLNARLSGPATTDWDIAVFDAKTGRYRNGSSSFGSNELAQLSLAPGEQVLVQACRRKGPAASVPLTLQFTVLAPGGPQPTISLVQIPGSTVRDFETLRRAGFDVTDDFNPKSGGVEMLLHGSADVAHLKSLGYNYKVKIADVDAQDRADRRADRSAPRAGPNEVPSGRTTYRHLNDINADLKTLAEQYPGMVRPITLPEKSLEGRDINGIEVSTDVTRTDDGRPVFVLLGNHHAREWPSDEATIEYAYDLLKNNGTNPRFKNIVDNARTIFVPVVNVDGFNAAIESGDDSAANQPANNTPQQAVGGLSYKRKNCAITEPAQPPCEGAPADLGVDLNRNYGEQWGGPGSSGDNTNLTYHGPDPFSEPETQAVREFLRNYQVTDLITNHTFAALVLRPPGTHFHGPAPDEIEMRRLGDEMAANTGYTSEYGYQLYDTSGTTDDWVYSGLSSFVYTIEIGGINFHPSYTAGFIPEYVGKSADVGGLREAFTLGAEAAIDPASHSILEGTAPAGTTLTITRNFDTVNSDMPDDEGNPHPLIVQPESRSTSLTVPASGKFTWNVSPSTRPFEADPVPWHLTCTDAAGKVFSSRDVYVARGQRLVMEACGAAAATAPGTRCSDKTKPTTKFAARKKLKLGRKRVKLSGKASDKGCVGASAALSKTGKVKTVSVSVARVLKGGKKCAYLTKKGKLSKAAKCSKPRFLRAKGTSSWKLTKKATLRKGKYLIRVQALDADGNKGAVTKKTLKVA